MSGAGRRAAAASRSPNQHQTQTKPKQQSIDGQNVKLDKYKGKVALVVNLASACGMTPQVRLRCVCAACAPRAASGVPRLLRERHVRRSTTNDTSPNNKTTKHTKKQYAELQGLFTKYGSKGFTVLGFPCNQFGAQEPGSNGRSRLSAVRLSLCGGGMTVRTCCCAHAAVHRCPPNNTLTHTTP